MILVLSGCRSRPASVIRCSTAASTWRARAWVLQWIKPSSAYLSNGQSGNSRPIHASNAQCRNRFASTGLTTPPTQQRTFAHVTLRVGGVVVAAAAGWLPDGDAVADGEFLWSYEDVLDDGAQDALSVLGGGGCRAGAEPGEEALEVAGELQVGVAAGGLGVEGCDLVFQPGLAGAEAWHPGSELVDGD